MVRLLLSEVEYRGDGDAGRSGTTDEAVKAIPSNGRRGINLERREENVIADFFE